MSRQRSTPGHPHVHVLPLLGEWVRRDFRIRYTQTALGSAWALIQPLALTAGFVLAFSRVAGLKVGIPYASFVFPGMLLWSLFSTGIGNATNSIANSMYVITKASYPRIVAPLAATLLPLVDLAAGLLVLPVLLLVQDSAAHFRPVPFVASIAGCLAITAGLGTALSAGAIFLRDVRNIVPLTVQLGLLVTPVAYETRRLPDVLTWNPLATYVQGFRSAVVAVPGPTWTEWGRAAAVTAVVIAIGVAYFHAVEDRFADVA